MIEIEKDAAAQNNLPPRAVWPAMWRGLKQLCPACGVGALFRRYLKVHDTCPNCQEALHHHRADDAPPYITIFLVGHIVVPGILLLEQAYAPPTWVHLVIWIPLLLVLSLLILPRIKGSLVGLQWALRMHGFGPFPDPDDFNPPQPVQQTRPD